jgi:hypothetical protein
MQGDAARKGKRQGLTNVAATGNGEEEQGKVPQADDNAEQNTGPTQTKPLSEAG